MSLAAFSVSIETGSTFFRFQLGLIYRLIDRPMNAAASESESCGRDSSKPAAAATFGAIGSKLANARAGHGWHHRKSLQHAQRARRGSGQIEEGANHRR